MKRLRGTTWMLLATAGLLADGCQTSTVPQQAPVMAQSNVSVDFSKEPMDGPPTTPDSITLTDVSATRLQDIGGYIMLYFRQHQQMPASLQDLASLPGGQELNFTAASGQPFGYEASGMWSPERSNKCIIAYDPELRNGKRWVLFMSIPKGGSALDVDVYNLPEPFFLNYRR